MQYIELGDTGLEVSRFGMGCMRLPRAEEGFDFEESKKLIRRAVDKGVNYFDTAYVYGNSEEVVGEALTDGYREKVVLTTKVPIWKADSHEDLYDLFEEELERLKTDYVDILLIHNLRPPIMHLLEELDVFTFIENTIESGKIKNIGFSFHGDKELFKEIVDMYDWDVCQIQLNFLDEKHQAGLEGLKYAASREIPVIIMEPLRGGALVNNVPDEVEKLYQSFKDNRPPVEWAFRYLYNKPEVAVILSGVSNKEQLDEDIEIFSNASAYCMDEDEVQLIEKVKELYRDSFYLGCTGCEYCLPCPQGIDIPEIFRMYNSMKMPEYQAHTKYQYKITMTEKGVDASSCVECGSCEDSCPQNIDVIEQLQKAHEMLTS